MNKFFYIITLAALLAITAPPVRAGDTAILGTGVGAALGGLVGSTIGKGDGNLAATGAGVFLGGVMGHSIGSSMEHARSPSYGRAPYYNSYNAFDDYGPYRPRPNYVGPTDYYYDDDGDRRRVKDYVFVKPGSLEYYGNDQAVLVEGGYVGPMPPDRERRRHGRHCREFTQTIRIDGQVHESYGTACLRPDGSWQIEQ